MTSILFQVKNELSGKCRSDRGGRKRRLEEDLASKEGANKVPARIGDKPYHEEITTERRCLRLDTKFRDVEDEAVRSTTDKASRIIG